MIRGRKRHGLIGNQEIPGFRKSLVQILQPSVEIFWPELCIPNIWARGYGLRRMRSAVLNEMRLFLGKGKLGSCDCQLSGLISYC